MNSKEIAFISVFASIWIVAQITLGPILGRFSVGPISLHGVINRIVGWMVMLILAETSNGFGRVSVMSLVAAVGTRIIRLSPLTGLVIGAGYFLGGFIFDIMFFTLSVRDRGKISRRLCFLSISAVSGTLTMIPFLLFRFSVLGSDAFRILTPMFALSIIKGVFFSLTGTFLGLSILPSVKALPQIGEV